MSDNDMLRILRANEARLKQTETKEVPTVWLPYAQRALNPVAVTTAMGELAQPWPALLVTFYVTVFVTTTNNATNFWTIDLIDALGNTLATVNTSAVAANAWARLLDTTVTQPASTNAVCTVVATTTLAPGTIYVVPNVACIRQG